MIPSLNDAVWRLAPHPALCVTRGDVLHWQANEAALRHPVCSSFDDAAWQALAERVIEVGGGRHVAHGTVALDVVACDQGWLAWLLPVDPFVATGLSAGEPMELAQVHGRIGLCVCPRIGSGSCSYTLRLCLHRARIRNRSRIRDEPVH